jgi:hypothetical protein
VGEQSCRKYFCDDYGAIIRLIAEDRLDEIGLAQRG